MSLAHQLAGARPLALLVGVGVWLSAAMVLEGGLLAVDGAVYCTSLLALVPVNRFLMCCLFVCVFRTHIAMCMHSIIAGVCAVVWLVPSMWQCTTHAKKLSVSLSAALEIWRVRMIDCRSFCSRS